MVKLDFEGFDFEKLAEPPAFTATERFEIKGRGEACIGIAPVDLTEYHVGLHVSVDGVTRKIVGIERGIRFPRKGEPCLLLLEKLP